LPTGGGKSLCYQLPACVFNGLTVVVSPLIALMEDQVIQLKRKGIRAAFLNHTVDDEEYIATMHEVRNRKIQLLYMAPETLVRRPEIHVMLDNSNVACLAIDEAHCVSQWGHDFRPNYRELDSVRKRLPNAVCIATTATATPQVQADIKQVLNFPEGHDFIDSFNRENLFLSVEPRFELLGQTLAFLKKHAGQTGIIYCQRRKHVDWLCKQLGAHGISALPYHAGLDPETRRQNQAAFMNGDTQVIVATIAFGMGIDKPDVRFVLHAWLPKNIESYYQEIGRSGRDGERAECLLLFSQNDEGVLKDFIDDGNLLQRKHSIKILQKFIAWAKSTECRRKTLLDYFEEQYEHENCGMCDNCHKAKMKQVDLTIPAQKFLSCLHRILDWIYKNNTKPEEFFDKAYFVGTLQGENTNIPICLPAAVLYIIDILRGEKQEKIISTWGKGKEYSKAQWCYLALQFLQNNLYERSAEDGSLDLTDKGRKVNTTKITPDDRFWGFPVDLVDMDWENSETVELNTDDFPLEEQYDYKPVPYEQLLKKRWRISDAAQIRPSEVLPINSLKEIAAKLPQTPEKFRQIHGIGEVRMKYADDFLPIIRAYCEEHKVASAEGTTEVRNTYERASEESNKYILALFKKLRDKRDELAEAEQVRASRVMTINSIKKMATQLPQSMKALSQIKGIGKTRMKYADDFLPIIRAYCEEHRIDSAETETGGLNTNDATSKKRDEYAHDLFEQLQDKCKTLEKAEQEGIFTDRMLREMATSFPRTREAFVQIRGVSLRKMEKYADDFLPIIRAYCEENGITDEF
ncbi:MAG: RecQ family ATP-dependent DNA helicase, partial [Candidatus Poribacteria bacterium]|nr:RecQ family ATP-dependent DNA helicase [Candidatus Poribacteria bacterium]